MVFARITAGGGQALLCAPRLWRVLSAADQCIQLAAGAPTAGPGRPTGRPRLAQYPAGADLGLSPGSNDSRAGSLVNDMSPPFRYRTIWLSDIHLGTRG